MKAYKADIEKNPDMTGAKISEIAKASNAELVVGKKKTPASSTTATSKKADAAPKVWYEARSDGASYYWNIETGGT